MVSTRPPTSKSSSLFSNPLVTVLNAPITIGIIVTCMFHSFFQFPSKVEVLILLFTFFIFLLWSAGTAKSTIFQYYYYYHYHYCCEFFTQALTDFFLFESGGLQIFSRTLLSILADLNNIIVWSPFVLLVPSTLIPILILWWQHHTRQLVPQSPSCSIFFSFVQQDQGTNLSFRFPSNLI